MWYTGFSVLQMNAVAHSQSGAIMKNNRCVLSADGALKSGALPPWARYRYIFESMELRKAKCVLFRIASDQRIDLSRKRCKKKRRKKEGKCKKKKGKQRKQRQRKIAGRL
jgi:hypothetical protein